MASTIICARSVCVQNAATDAPLIARKIRYCSVVRPYIGNASAAAAGQNCARSMRAHNGIDAADADAGDCSSGATSLSLSVSPFPSPGLVPGLSFLTWPSLCLTPFCSMFRVSVQTVILLARFRIWDSLLTPSQLQRARARRRAHCCGVDACSSRFTKISHCRRMAAK